MNTLSNSSVYFDYNISDVEQPGSYFSTIMNYSPNIRISSKVRMSYHYMRELKLVVLDFSGELCGRRKSC